MGKWLFKVAMVAALAAAALPCARASAATITASASASVVKPLTLTSTQPFDLGTITIGPGTWSNATVSLTQAGVLTCSSSVICSGATQVAKFNVAGSKAYTVGISAPDVTLTNQNDPTQTLVLTLDYPATVYLTNSGAPGSNFSVGGKITLNSKTGGGTYSGTINVTANYQ